VGFFTFGGMKLHSVNAGHFKLDGGAMFGVVPKSIWHKLNPADENNMCSWAMRCLLIEDGNRLILVDNGMGDKQDAKFFGYYYLHGDDSLEKSFRACGFHFSDVTDVILTHLHFDHCGGSIKYNSNRTRLEPAFPNATYYCSEKHWNWAVNPNPREKASFLKENIVPIRESGQLKFITPESAILPGISFLEVNGHTESMLLPLVKTKQHTVCYLADLIPSTFHLPLPYVMAYDVRPLETLQEKEKILRRAVSENWLFFYEHDPAIACSALVQTEKGIRKGELVDVALL
jgi:glyoxylase-like metal-dependent hydrolase (beta-lactamase superfamily II)